MVQLIRRYAFLGVFIFLAVQACAQQQDKVLQFTPAATLANGKHVVLISGDEEYRSEESLPMLARILTEHHGFKTTVLFAINPETGFVDPTYTKNIPGMENLATADLMIIATRFRELPDSQMKYVAEYLKAGKPVVGFRTATHSFNFGKDSTSPYAKYGYDSKAKSWEGGFGKQVLGETWISHHGDHGREGTRGLINGIQKDKKHPILKGVSDIWGPTDVYTVAALVPEAEVLVWGQSTLGMNDKSPLSWEKTIMPVAWTKPYSVDSGKKGKVFTTTMGSAIDFLNEDLRRLVINACYWAVDLEEKSTEGAKVDIVGAYHPTMFGFGDFKKGKLPKDFVN